MPSRVCAALAGRFDARVASLGDIVQRRHFQLEETRASFMSARRVASILERHVFVVLVAALAAVLLVLRLRDQVAQDSWLAFLGGREVLEHGLPRTDEIAIWTGGHEWVDQQWLAQVVFRGFFAAGGLKLALFLHMGMLVAAFAIALATARARGASARSAAAVGAVALLAMLPNTAMRTQSLAFLLFAGLLFLLVRDLRARDRWVLLSLPLIAVWANVHGSVLVGAGLTILAGLLRLVEHFRTGRQGRPIRAALLTVGPLACLFASPYGFALVDYYHRILVSPDFSRMVTEWEPTKFPADWPFFVLALGGLWLAASSRKGLSLLEQLVFVAMLLLGLTAVRNIAWFALAAAAILPAALDAAWPESTAKRRFRVNVALIGAAGVAVVIFGASAVLRPTSWYERSYPVAAADVVAEAAAAAPEERIFASERFADWLVWSHPALRGRVAYDARFELLSRADLERVVRFRGQIGPSWRAAARGYGLLVLEPDLDRGPVAAVKAERGTQTLYEDDAVVVLRRSRSS